MEINWSNNPKNNIFNKMSLTKQSLHLPNNWQSDPNIYMLNPNTNWQRNVDGNVNFGESINDIREFEREFERELRKRYPSPARLNYNDLQKQS